MKKFSHFDLKSESQAELKFDPGFQVIGEYLSQFDSLLRDNLTQKLTLNNESILLKYSPITWNPEFNFSSTSDSSF